TWSRQRANAQEEGRDQKWHNHSPRTRAPGPEPSAVEDGAALQSPCASAGSESGDAPYFCEETAAGRAARGDPPGSPAGHAAQGRTCGGRTVNLLSVCAAS